MGRFRGAAVVTVAPQPKRKRAPRKESFLLSKDAFNLDVGEIQKMDEEQAFALFTKLRYARSNGLPVCPKCACDATYTIKRWNPKHTVCRTIFKCKRCDAQFTPTSDTKLKGRKMTYQKILLAIGLFVQSPKGKSTLEMKAFLQCYYKPAWALIHKLRESMADALVADCRPYEGEVEADSTWVGGHLRPKNLRAENDPKNPSKTKKNPWAYPFLGPTKKNVTAVVERGPNGRAFIGIADLEKDSPGFVLKKVNNNTTLFTDKASVYENLAWKVAHHYTVNHSRYFWSGEANTNTVEALFSVLKRAVRGIYHHISNPKYVLLYLQETAWRWTHRRVCTGDKFALAVGAFGLGGRSALCGLWQRRKAIA